MGDFTRHDNIVDLHKPYPSTTDSSSDQKGCCVPVKQMIQKFRSKEKPMKGDDMELEEEGDENKERGNWSGKLDFLLSAIGYAVGLGNVWRFPYIAYSNGGASFLIPYTVMLLLAGLPLFFLEMSFGQFGSLGPISVWRAVPILKGLGWAMVIISGLVAVYYNMIIAYTLYYTFRSFTSKVPWQDCQPEWVEKYGCQERTPMNATMRNITTFLCAKWKMENATNTTEYLSSCGKKTPSEVFWEREVLDISSGFEEGSGEIRWQLVLCLLLAWIIIFLCLSKGIKSSGKVVYVTATFPYIVLIILLIRNATLPGAYLGIEFYIIPDWAKLRDAKVWYSAASQIFYSLGVAFGGLETMASYNKFKNNVYRDSLIVAVLNCATSVFAGFVIFSVIGHMAFITGLKVEDVVADGPGLAFIAYPEGIAMMPVAPLWAILFFLMLFTLGLDSQFAMMETVISALVDEFQWFRQGYRKIGLTIVLCIIFFLIGLPQCSRAGIYVMTLFDSRSAGFSLMIVALLELIGIAWVYGFFRICEDIEMMIGFKPNAYWAIMWNVITPAMLLFIIIFSAVQYSPVKYQDYVFPQSASICGWIMVALPILAIIFCALLTCYRSYKSGDHYTDMLHRAITPTAEWGPALNKYRTGRYSELPELDTPHPVLNFSDINEKAGYPDTGYHDNEGYDEKTTTHM